MVYVELSAITHPFIMDTHIILINQLIYQLIPGNFGPPLVCINHVSSTHKFYDCRARIPDSMSDEEGAFMEPLAVAVHDCRRGGVGEGKAVLVLGAGAFRQFDSQAKLFSCLDTK